MALALTWRTDLTFLLMKRVFILHLHYVRSTDRRPVSFTSTLKQQSNHRIAHLYGKNIVECIYCWIQPCVKSVRKLQEFKMCLFTVNKNSNVKLTTANKFKESYIIISWSVLPGCFYRGQPTCWFHPRLSSAHGIQRSKSPVLSRWISL